MNHHVRTAAEPAAVAAAPAPADEGRFACASAVRAMHAKLRITDTEPPLHPDHGHRNIARKQLDRAGENTAAAREIADRLDGKPAQEAGVTVARVNATELSDDELLRIAGRKRRGHTSSLRPPGGTNWGRVGIRVPQARL